MKLEPTSFRMTRQGVRNLDQIDGPLVPFSGGPVPAERRIPNVGERERAISTIAGGALVGVGLANLSMGGALLTLAGAALVYRGISGKCELYRLLGVSTADASQTPTELAYRV